MMDGVLSVGTPSTAPLQSSLQDGTVSLNGNSKAADLSPVKLMCPYLTNTPCLGGVYLQPFRQE